MAAHGSIPGTKGNTLSKPDYSKLVIPAVPTVGFEDITPAIAATMLSFNRKNRNVNEKVVNELVRSILNGQFVNNGDAIRFSVPVPVEANPGGLPLPLLLDGQHRLEAIKRSDKTVRVLVIRDLHPDSQATMDIGRKRTAADWMKIQGHKESTALGAVLAAVWKLNRGDSMLSTNPKPTPIECSALLEASPGIERSVEVAVRTYGGFRHLKKTSYGVAHHMISQIAPEAASYFFALIETGANIPTGHPILAMRDRASILASRHNEPMSTRRELNLIFRAWNYCVESKQATSIAPPDPSAPVMELLIPKFEVIPFLDDPKSAEKKR